MVTSYKSRGAILRVPFLLIKKWFPFGFLRLLDTMDVNPVLAFVAIARLCETNWSALDDQSWFSYEYDEGTLIILRGTELLKRILPDGTKEWRDGEEEIRPIYRKDYESCGMMEAFAKAAWLWYIDSGEDYYELPSLEAQDTLLNPW